ncbi:helix-turn-helix transcriptional regulator [uncultured Bacteroides sp.]|uniref:helix-turn-helix domain-containing protein n=1 Tax=uncultured Bacteroides sp. TaxID=162156 RepID=UPI0025E0CB55|nr:helix-turn-helix transcriptional regulator [uncultured Bacteroides sp.]
MIDRIKTLIATKARSVREFAELIGVKQVTLNQQLAGDRKLSLDIISSILNSFENISAEWLLRGAGDMYKNVEASTNAEIEEDSPKDKFYKDIIFTYQERAKEYRKKIEYLEAELAKAVPFTEEEKKQSKSA